MAILTMSTIIRKICVELLSNQVLKFANQEIIRRPDPLLLSISPCNIHPRFIHDTPLILFQQEKVYKGRKSGEKIISKRDLCNEREISQVCTDCFLYVEFPFNLLSLFSLAFIPHNDERYMVSLYIMEVRTQATGWKISSLYV